MGNIKLHRVPIDARGIESLKPCRQLGITMADEARLWSFYDYELLRCIDPESYPRNNLAGDTAISQDVGIHGYLELLRLPGSQRKLSAMGG